MITMNRIAQAALLAGFCVNIFLQVLVIDTNYGGALGFTALSPPIRMAATLTMIACGLASILISKRILVDALTVGLATYLALGIAVGLTREHATYEFARHVFAGTTMLAAYWCGISLRGTMIDEQLFKALAIATALAGVIALAISIPMMHGFGFTLSPSPTLVVLDALMHGSSKLLLLLWIPVLVFANRRAFFLAIAFMMSILITRRLLKGYPTPVRWSATAVVTAATFAALIAATHVAGSVVARLGGEDQAFERAARMVGTVTAPTESAAPINDSAPTSTPAAEKPAEMTRMDKLLSGRISQGRAVLEAISLSPILGNGFGAQYTWRYWSDNLNSLQTVTLAQTDGMPFYFLLTNGIVGLAIPLLIVAALASLFSRSLRGGMGIGALFVLGFAVDMMLTFQPNAHLFWLLLGFYSGLRTWEFAWRRTAEPL